MKKKQRIEQLECEIDALTRENNRLTRIIENIPKIDKYNEVLQHNEELKNHLAEITRQKVEMKAQIQILEKAGKAYGELYNVFAKYEDFEEAKDGETYY